MKQAFLIVATLALSACGSLDIQRISGNPGTYLDPHGSVYVAVPAAPSSDYPQAGQYVASGLAAEFADNNIIVSIGEGPATTEENSGAARAAHAKYLVVPYVTNWDHSATQWTTNPSTMAVRVTIYDAQTGEKVREDNLVSQSRRISFFGTDPKDLFEDAVEDYMEELYAPTPSPSQQK
ncbi:MAG TPA: DUF4823 domain-containing protein [Burkholderiales bacterium]|nr:DUF4823 domain-containing protein [Burkholderiales bacterium]